MEAAQEYQIRELCFWVCVNMIANAIGRCEFRTFHNGKEIKGKEYYMWNVEPNANQNSTAFFHKLIAQLCQDNEALIINTRPHGEIETLVVADDWQAPEEYPAKQNEYKSVRVGEVTYKKTFKENEVMHLKLNHLNLRPVINAIYASYYRLVQAAMKGYEWDNGQHWKVHVAQTTQGSPGWMESFKEMLNTQLKPFFESNGAVLPEFDGYSYENVGGKNNTKAAESSRDTKKFIEDIFDFTARSFQIPAVLASGTVEATADASARFLSFCIDPICDQIQEEANRKRYGYEEWRAGNYLQVDSSSILHFDLFANAANVEKLVGSGAFTINDVRKAAGQAIINEPWADQFWLTKNIGNLAGLEATGGEKGGEENGGTE